MLATSSTIEKTGFSKEAIGHQLQKIVSSPILESSLILKRMLLFIVGEALAMQTSTLKEYTIAIKVLKKPVEFRPQDSGIVRIHVGRLRRALNQYYGTEGLLDPIRISIPKGAYIPVFETNEDDRLLKLAASRKSVVVGVIPFTCLQQSNTAISFSNALGIQLSKALMEIETFSVVAFHSMQSVSSRPLTVEEMGVALGAKFLIAGTVQVVNKSIRVHIQMIWSRTGQLLWSEMFERKFVASEVFAMQDQVVQSIITEIGQLAF